MQTEASSFPPDPRDRQKFVFHRTILRRIIVWILRKLLPMVIKVNVSGMENIPKTGAAILAFNHLTTYDVFPVQMEIQRPLFFMAKSELHKNPIMDVLLRNLGAFPVHRGEKDHWAINHAEKVIEHEQLLAMFPEGTRSRGKGLRAGKTGVARLSVKMDCPIIPVAIEGTERMYKNLPHRSVITMNIGEAITGREGESILGLTDRLMFKIAEMLPLNLRGVYANKPQGFDL
jgi:1-acyl-sn-glycerol-3-phosphate acyltransferase